MTIKRAAGFAIMAAGAACGLYATWAIYVSYALSGLFGTGVYQNLIAALAMLSVSMLAVAYGYRLSRRLS